MLSANLLYSCRFQTGAFRENGGASERLLSRPKDLEKRRVKTTIKAIWDRGRSLLTLAILSGNLAAVDWATKIIWDHFEPPQV